MRRAPDSWRGQATVAAVAAAAATLLLLVVGTAAAAEAEDGADGGNALDGGGGGAWADGTAERRPKAGSSLGAMGRSVLADLARQLVTNYETNSQVLSLNLTNLLILLVLKALLFGAGMFSFGLLNHKGGLHATGRSAEGSAPSYFPSLTEGELLLALSFLAGDSAAAAGAKAGEAAGPRGRSADGAATPYACLHRVSCEQPEKAREYAGAGRLLLQGARILEGVIPYNPKYEAIVAGMQRAADFGRSGGDCGSRYACAKTS